MRLTPAEARELLEEVWNAPARRVHLDWYEGPVQSVFLHPDGRAVYLCAVRFGAAGERLYAALPLLDPAVLDELGDLETRDGSDWLVEIGREVLLPAAGAQGFWTTVRDGAVAAVEPMTAEERATVQPRTLHDLLAG
jgi:hypothetical protein